MKERLKQRIAELQQESDRKYEEKLQAYEERQRQAGKQPKQKKVKPAGSKIPHKGWAIVIICLIIWGSVVLSDYWTANHRLQEPVFAWQVASQADGVGIYQGVGYRVELTGDFLPGEEPKEINKAEFYFFGQLVSTSTSEQKEPETAEQG